MVAPLAAGAAALKYLPVIGAGLGFTKGLTEPGGDLGQAALQSGIGALTFGLGAGPISAGATRLAGQALAPFTGTTLGAAQAARNLPLIGALLPKGGGLAQAEALGRNVTRLARGATALAGPAAALAVPMAAQGVVDQVGRSLGRGARGGLQTGAGIIGYTGAGEPVYGGQAVPGGMGSYGPTPPTGDPLSVLGPEGMGRRLEQLKSAEAQRDAMRLLLPEVYKASEARSKSEFERQMAAAGIRQNIATRAAMLQAAQAAGLGMGQTAAAQAGGALTSQYQYQ